MPVDQKTQEAFQNLEVGMFFHEMYSFWVHVLALGEEGVIVQELRICGDISRAWGSEMKCFYTRERMEKNYSYDTRPGYWVTYTETRGMRRIPVELENMTPEEVDLLIHKTLEDRRERFTWARIRFESLELD